MKTIIAAKTWDYFVKTHGGHPLQLWAWGETKSLHGWRAIRYQSDDGTWGAQVLCKRLPKPMKSFAYIPRGPIGEPTAIQINELVDAVQHDIRADVVMLEPDREETTLGSDWKKTSHSVLVAKTLILELAKTPDELLADMAKKTRQYVRKSLKTIHVKRITEGRGVQACMEVYAQTAKRANFALHNEEYYFDIYRLLDEDVYIYGAYDEDVLVAFLWLVATPNCAFELYGGVTDRGQELKANYGLKWEAIQDLQRKGVKRYDMNGLLNDGISTFKRGFASHETQLVGSYEKPLSIWYPIWAHGLPLAKRVVRLFRS